MVKMYLIADDVMSEDTAKGVVKVITENFNGIAKVEHQLPMLYQDPNVPDYELILAKVSFDESDINSVVAKIGTINDTLDKQFGLAMLYPVKITNPNEVDTMGDFHIIDDYSRSGLFEEDEK